MRDCEISLDVDARCRRCLLTVSSSACDCEAPEHVRRSCRAYRSHGTRGANGHLVRDGRGTLLRAAHPGSAGGAVAASDESHPCWPPGGGYQRTPSDSGGRYTVAGIPAGFGSFIVSTSYADGKYAQQCATTVTLNADANQDVTLTSLQNLAAGNSLRPPHVPGTRIISGVVFEVTAAGRQPIEGATVGFEGNDDITSAGTLTDGAAAICSADCPKAD